MTRIRHGSEPSGGTLKIWGAHSDSRPAQKGQDGLSPRAGLGLVGLWDLRSVGRRERAGEKTTHRPNTASRRASVVLEASAIAFQKLPATARNADGSLCAPFAAESAGLGIELAGRPADRWDPEVIEAVENWLVTGSLPSGAQRV